MSLLRTVSLVGFALVLLGAAGVAWGFVGPVPDTCTSGSGITVFRLGANETVDPETDVVAFEDLSSSEQAAFREAYADIDPEYESGSTDVYQGGVGWETDARVVEYRGDRYEVAQFVADCGPGAGWFVSVVGIGVALVGGTVVGLAGVVRGYRRVAD